MKNYLSTKDFLVSGESFDLLYDSERQMLITSPIPEEDNLAAYYESEEYISHTDKANGVMNFLYQKVKKIALSSKLNLVNSFHKEKGNLLDIGCGTGDFLRTLKNDQWEIYGVEPNYKARNFASEKGLDVTSSIEDISNKQFNVVTLWHVLEHLPDLESVIQKIETLVKPGGILIIAVPNFKSYDAKHYKNYWAAFDVPRHLWHFSKESMNTLFSSEMKLERIKPMIFDSFYVSLLSEKYKLGSTFSIKAMWIGLLSNLKGFYSKEYSSHIYCFRKDEKAN